MFNFFETIFSFLKIAVIYIVNFFKQLLSLFENIGNALVQITIVTNYLPAYVKVFITSFIFVGIVYFLLNRD